MPKKIFLLALLFCMAAQFSSAQQKWNLRTIVDYAMANNIGVKLSDVQAKVSALIYNQNKLSQYPSLSFSGNTALNSGSNQDPTSFSRITQTYLSSGLQLQSSAEIFNFYSKRNTIAASQWELEASKANVEKSKNDIALNAANAYLQILLALQQQEIASVQVQQTQAQLSNTQKLVKAGSLPELNASQLEAQLATDSVSYITAKGNVTQAILSLKTYMSIPADVPFDVDTPPIESIPVEPIAEMQPADVYRLALANQPQQVYDSFKIKAAEKNAAAARGFMYPTFSLFGNLGSSYLVANTPNNKPSISGYIPTTSKVNVNNQDYYIQTPTYVFTRNGTIRSAPFGTQISDNFRQSIGLNISVPIFNGGSLRTNWETSKLQISSLQLQKKLDDQTLKQNIYSAY
ncbi:MAG: TolC family protein, partial [Ferruginibacter sp.]